MSTSTFPEIFDAIGSARRIAVASHLRPDADALGSTIAFALWLRAIGKEVLAWNEDGVPDKFLYLPGHEIVSRPPAGKVAVDLFVALDTSVFKRLGTCASAAEGAPAIVNIDHHVSNDGYGTFNYVDPSSPATGQILVDFLRHVGADVTPAIASNLFAAISTDTGSFQYAGTNERTFDAASFLVGRGVNVAALSREMYECQPRRRFELLRHALNNAEFTDNGRVASFTLTLADASRLGVLPEDNEGIIDHLRSIEGVEAAVFFEELPGGLVRVSARSKNPSVDVCRVCGIFRGGGHPMASGARIAGPVAKVREDFLQAVINEVRK